MRGRARVLLATGLFLGAGPCAPGPNAPGGPGERPTWTNGNKQGIGTALTAGSKVWFTLGEGVLTELYYPTLDKANTRVLELVVADGQGLLERESVDTDHGIEVPDPYALVFRQINTSRTGRYRITKTTFADPERPVVAVQVRFERLAGGPLRVFAFFDPSVANSGLGDSAYERDRALVAEDSGVAVAVACSSGFAATNSGYAGTSDGLTELARGRPLPAHQRAGRGNVAQLAEVALPDPEARDADFTLAVGFGTDGRSALAQARASLSRPAGEVLRSYAKGWSDYLSSLRSVGPPYTRQFAMAAMVLKAQEDKTHPGAMIASLTIPWGDEVDAGRGNVGGYHLVWSRDLYHVATAFLALGDRAAADRALSYLFEVQQRPDGSFPQNSWLDGRPFWSSVQLDEVAYPLLLAHELGRTDARTYRRHVRPAAEYLLRKGPATPQERWEEEGGFSPSTIAAEIAGLIAAAAIAESNGDAEAAARYRATADVWAERLPSWTVTRTGPLASEPYFLRITQDGFPDRGRLLELNNGSGRHDERAIVDAGFLELVRLGIRTPEDPLVVGSVGLVDRVLRVDTPNGPGFYRYNHDGYGEKPDGRGWDGAGVGRLWTLLTGERGEFELAAGRDARPYLEAMLGFANDGLMLPEQVWDRPASPRPSLRFGEGTGSATPLAWSCAQFVRLAVGVEERRVVGRPEIVREHFERRRSAAARAGVVAGERPSGRPPRVKRREMNDAPATRAGP